VLVSSDPGMAGVGGQVVKPRALKGVRSNQEQAVTYQGQKKKPTGEKRVEKPLLLLRKQICTKEEGC